MLPSLAQILKSVKGKKYGILTHQAAVDEKGNPYLEGLIASGFPPVVIFTPEHGFYGFALDHEPCHHSTFQGIPLYSLYGESKESLFPQEGLLQGLDCLLVALVDIGVRYYTYAASALYLLRKAHGMGIPVFVIDRPNPLGRPVEGPLLKEGFESFVGAFTVPIRHGLTLGELLLYQSKQEKLQDGLEVIPCPFSTHPKAPLPKTLPWLPPSPHMPFPETAWLYPGTCLIEATNCSEGRGTTYPFFVCGAPFLDGNALARDLVLKDVNIHPLPYSFKPQYGKWAQQVCHGVFLHVRQFQGLKPLYFGIHLLKALFSQPGVELRKDPYEFETHRPALDLLFGSDALRRYLKGQIIFSQLVSTIKDDEKIFKERVMDHYLYK